MRTRDSLAAWDAAVTAYLANRRALGRTYENDEYSLNRVRRFLVDAGATDLDEQLFDRWRASFYRASNRTRIMRERAVYKFCRYRRRSEPHCFLPDPTSFARPKPLPLPRIIEREQVIRLVRYVSALLPSSREPLRPTVLRFAILLLYTTGLRRGELVRLTLGDVDAQRGVLFVCDSKFHKSRWVPLSSSMRSELRSYLEVRRRAGFDCRPRAPLICHARGRAYTGVGFGRTLTELLDAVGIRDQNRRRPRVQDFRHSFAVAALLRWYENGEDVQVNLPKLALYMGHVSIVSTAYYLRWMPAVIARAGERFGRSFGQVIEGGAS
jgi:integrase/recombinase XerD